MVKRSKIDLNEVSLRVQQCKALSVCVVDAVEKVEASGNEGKNECFQDLMNLAYMMQDCATALKNYVVI